MNANNKIIYLHIGLPKTGTSSLQVFFAKNVQALHKHGIKYPGLIRRVGKGEVISSGNGEKFARYAFTSDPKEHKKSLKFLASALRSSGGDILVSSELLSVWDVNRHRAFKEYVAKFNCNVKIILYLRDQAEILVTQYFQHIKRDLALYDYGQWEFEDYITGKNFAEFANYNIQTGGVYLDFGKLLDMLVSVYGKSQIRVQSIKKDLLVGRDIFIDFLHAISISSYEDFDGNIPIINPTPTHQEMYIRTLMNMFNPSYETSDEYLKVISRIHAVMGADSNENYFISPEAINSIRTQFEQSTLAVCREWFGKDSIAKVLNQKMYGEKIKFDSNNMHIDNIIAVFSGLLVDLFGRVEQLENKWRIGRKLWKIFKKQKKVENRG